MATITGTDNPDDLQGTLEADLIEGLRGNDTIHCGVFVGGDPRFDGADTVLGGAGKDSIFAALGNDWIEGGGHADLIFGNAGKDSLYGNGGEDRLFGSQGRDVLVGGRSADTLEGGAGRDRFTYETDEIQDDTITDFTPGDDRIVFKREALGVGGVVFIGTDEFSGEGHGEVRYRTGEGFTVVEFDNDGDGSLDIRMLLDGAALTLTAADFVFG